MARVFGGTGEPRNDAVAPHPESEAAQLQLIRERFAAGLKHTCQATATWTDSNVRQLKVFSKWLGDQDGDARRILDRTLAGFFADPRAADAGFPIAFLAGTPDKYLRPPLPPARASPGRGKLTPTRGTTEKDTANAPDEAEQLAALQKQWGSHGRA